MAKRSGKSGKPTALRTLAEFSAALSSPLTTVARWVKHPEWKWSRKAPWAAGIVPDVLRWAATVLERGRPATSANSDDLRRVKLFQEVRKLRAQADTAETALAKERGQLLDAATVEREWATVGAIIRNAAENLPSQIVPLALTHGMPHESAAAFQAQVEQLVAAVLEHLSRDPGSEIAEEGEASVLPEPAPA